MRAYEAKIGPKEAQDMLGRSAHFTNRHINKERVRNYATDMRNGAWSLNGEPIIQDDNRVVIDGQHRLRAVIESGATISFLIVEGVRREAARTIDQGLSRTMAHGMQMSGMKNANDVVAAARTLHCLRSNVDPQSATGQRRNSATNMATVDEVQAFLALEAPGIEAFVEAMPKQAAKALRLNEMAAAAYEFSLIESQSDALEWAHGFVGGLPLDDPRQLLRDRLIEDKLIIANRQRAGRSVARHREQRLDLMVQSWNLWIGGHRVNGRVYTLRGDAEFPIVIPIDRATSDARTSDGVNRRDVLGLRGAGYNRKK
jgi:hypothetical protein